MAKAWEIAKDISSKFELNDGNSIPAFGLGMYQSSAGKNGGAETAVGIALEEGYRLVDTAELYHNETDVGNAIKQSGIDRKEIYVVTKVWDHGYDHCLEAFDGSIKKLGLDYVDMYLMHTPLGGKILQTYDAMLKLKEKGVAKSIGVSNFNISTLEGLLKSGRPLPSVNQIELHPYMRRQELVNYCRNHGIHIMAYSPVTKGKRLKELQVLSIAEKYNKSVAQLFIRWCVQSGFVVIPKSSNKERIHENCQVFDWSISDDDMTKLASLPEATCLDVTSYIYNVHDLQWQE